MNTTLRPTLVCLRISSVLYVLLALGSVFACSVASFEGETEVDAIILRVTLALLGVFSLVVGVFVEVVIRALKRRKYWSWIAGICLSALYISSIFMILGIIMLINLLKDKSRTFFVRSSD